MPLFQNFSQIFKSKGRNSECTTVVCKAVCTHHKACPEDQLEDHPAAR